jgi:hypothetical protein
MATPRKIIMAIFCDNDEQAAALQNIAKEFCSEYRPNAVDILAMYPKIKRNKSLIKEAVRAGQTGGKMALLRVIPGIINAIFK